MEEGQRATPALKADVGFAFRAKWLARWSLLTGRPVKELERHGREPRACRAPYC